jgi:hypothetical protein
VQLRKLLSFSHFLKEPFSHFIGRLISRTEPGRIEGAERLWGWRSAHRFQEILQENNIVRRGLAPAHPPSLPPPAPLAKPHTLAREGVLLLDMARAWRWARGHIITHGESDTETLGRSLVTRLVRRICIRTLCWLYFVLLSPSLPLYTLCFGCANFFDICFHFAYLTSNISKENLACFVVERHESRVNNKPFCGTPHQQVTHLCTPAQLSATWGIHPSFYMIDHSKKNEQNLKYSHVEIYRIRRLISMARSTRGSSSVVSCWIWSTCIYDMPPLLFQMSRWFSLRTTARWARHVAGRRAVLRGS